MILLGGRSNKNLSRVLLNISIKLAIVYEHPKLQPAAKVAQQSKKRGLLDFVAHLQPPTTFETTTQYLEAKLLGPADKVPALSGKLP